MLDLHISARLIFVSYFAHYFMFSSSSSSFDVTPRWVVPSAVQRNGEVVGLRGPRSVVRRCLPIPGRLPFRTDRSPSSSAAAHARTTYAPPLGNATPRTERIQCRTESFCSTTVRQTMGLSLEGVSE